MPIVPFTSAQGRLVQQQAKGKLPPGPPPAEPFALMAAAQMHSEGRLLEGNPSIEDRRDQTSKEADRNMVEDLQLPEEPWTDPTRNNSKLAKDLGSNDLDDASARKMIEAINRGMAK